MGVPCLKDSPGAHKDRDAFSLAVPYVNLAMESPQEFELRTLEEMSEFLMFVRVRKPRRKGRKVQVRQPWAKAPKVKKVQRLLKVKKVKARIPSWRMRCPAGEEGEEEEEPSEADSEA